MSIKPQNVIHLFGDVWITDTVTSTWVLMALVMAVVLVVRRRQPFALEMLLEGLTGMFSDVMGERAIQYIPFLGTLAIFIALANNFSVIPFLTSPTADISTPLALALVLFFAVHYYGIREKGGWQYLKDLASPVYLAPLTLPLELIGQLSRTLSLTLRLFGNIVSGELVVAVIALLAPLLAPLPLVGLGMFTGVLQAYIFTILAAVYINSGVESSTA
ncbi:MAG: F0F1 ATP synthase subunit A [Chloroflexota bacterium]|nr:F0F1 ATP synthase subunit A [Chloroflexota bacterium]